MLLNINKNVAFSQILPKPEVCANPPAVQVKSCRNNRDSLQAQLNFMGAINKTLVHSPSSVLDKYLNGMHHYKFEDATILCTQEEGEVFSKIVLFDKPIGFIDAILFLDQHIYSFKHSKKQGLNLDLEPWHFCKYNKALSSYTALKNAPIKGIIGQGRSSTAFLTAKNDVIKLSVEPLYPLPGKLINGVDLHILDTYLMPKGKSKGIIRGMKEPLVENSL